MSWKDQNELIALGRRVLSATGSNAPSEKSMISQLASSTGVGYHAARDAYVKSILDPLLQDKVRKSMKWLMHANFTPKFVDDPIPIGDADDSAETFSADSPPIPKRMFNIDTGNLEYWPSGQYAILSHSWKGQEISYPFITTIQANRKKREQYETAQDDSDEEGRRFSKFKAKKFKHLEAGKSDIELLSAQCTYDIEAQVKKINAVQIRSRTKFTTRELLVELAEFKIATWEEKEARKSSNAEKEALEVRKKEDKSLADEKKVQGVDNLVITDIKDDLSKDFDKAAEELSDAEELLLKAKKRLEKATTSFEVWNQNTALLSAVEDLLPVLERKKSMNKIEGSMREATKILDSGLFPANGRKRYLWNDTCCINKGDANELTESLAMMGEWYNNADFCLVHLDTPVYTEWVATWDNMENETPSFSSFDEVADPKWATRGWTLQELVLSKMTFYVNSLWQPLNRPVEGLGPYYYHCSYLDQHIRDEDISNVPPEAKSALKDFTVLQELMDTGDSGETIKYTAYPGCSEKWRMLIGILDFLEVRFPGHMDDDNSGAHIRRTISSAANDIERHLRDETDKAKRLKALFKALGLDMKPIRPQSRNLIKLLARTLVEECRDDIDKDRRRISDFTNVPPTECCRGLSRPTHPAHEILSLASYRECTVPIDRVYSLMGVLSVKFAAFHAEGPTRALCRLLDEVVITTNDVSIFNWAGKDLGSPIRGRSLYPSNLTAFSPQRTDNYFTNRRNDVLARASKEKRYGLQDTASRLTLLLRRTIEFVKRTKAYQEVPIDLIQTILKFIRETDLKDLRPQLVNLGKLLVYVEKSSSFEQYKPKTTRSRTQSESNKTVGEDKKAQSGGITGSRFGIPQMPTMPTMPTMPQISAPKLKVGGFGLYGKKTAPKEPEPAKEALIAAPTQPPVETVQKLAEPEKLVEPETLVGEVTTWIDKDGNVQNVPDEFTPLFNHLESPNLDGLVGRQKKKTTRTSLNESMVCPNPIMLTTSGIEGVFDIQRVIITMANPEKLRYEVRSAVNESQKVSGQCTISTALSTITVNFSCTAGVLGTQLDVCDVVEQSLSEVKSRKEDGGSKQTRPPLSSAQEGSSYYSKIASYSSSFIRPGSHAPGATEDEASKDDPQDPTTPNQGYGETAAQRKVSRMLDFVQETNINLVVGEWVLARFTGADGAKWFLCLLELGSTHSYYGTRIATDDIDFANVVPESGLEGHWETYMRNKKNELCSVVTVLIQGRIARRWADEVTSPDKEKDQEALIQNTMDEDSDNEVPGSESPVSEVPSAKQASNKDKLLDFLVKRGTLLGADLVQSVTDSWGKRLDGMLSDTILQQVPKELRAAITNLNENEDLLPAMFLSGVQVHMF